MPPSSFLVHFKLPLNKLLAEYIFQQKNQMNSTSNRPNVANPKTLISPVNFGTSIYCQPILV